jgi:hypothetical protein
MYIANGFLNDVFLNRPRTSICFTYVKAVLISSERGRVKLWGKGEVKQMDLPTYVYIYIYIYVYIFLSFYPSLFLKFGPMPLFLFFDTQTMQIRYVNYTQQHCYDFPTNLIPWQELDSCLQFLMWVQCPLCHAAPPGQGFARFCSELSFGPIKGLFTWTVQCRFPFPEQGLVKTTFGQMDFPPKDPNLVRHLGPK